MGMGLHYQTAVTSVGTPIFGAGTHAASSANGMSVLDNRTSSSSGVAAAVAIDNLRTLQDQNAKLLGSLEALEGECRRLQADKTALSSENEKLRQEAFELQVRAGAEEGVRHRMGVEVLDRDKQVKTLIGQNTELLKLVESQDERLLALESEVRKLTDEGALLRTHLAGALGTIQAGEVRAEALAREASQRTAEAEAAHKEAAIAKAQAAEVQRKATVDMESLQEALRVRKEKQYTLLEKTATAEEGARKAADEVAALQDALRNAHARVTELEIKLSSAEKANSTQAEQFKSASSEAVSVRHALSESRSRVDALEQDKARLEADVRASGGQLRDMAEKVFALLERLKLAETAKGKALDSLRGREAEVGALRTKVERFEKEGGRDSKARAVLEDQVRRLTEEAEVQRAHASALANKLKDEARRAMKEAGDREGWEDKHRVLQGRVTFLLNKLQSEEAAAAAAKSSLASIEDQLKAALKRTEEANKRADALAEERASISTVLAGVSRERDALKEQCDVLEARANEAAAASSAAAAAGRIAANNSYDIGTEHDSSIYMIDEGDAGMESDGGGSGSAVDRDRAAIATEPTNDQVRASKGKGRFYLHHKASQGLLLLRADRQSAKALLSRLGVNDVLKKAQSSKANPARERYVRLAASLLGLLLVESEEKTVLQGLTAQLSGQVEALGRVVDALQVRLAREEEARRRVIVRYGRSTAAEAIRAAVTSSLASPHQAAAASVTFDPVLGGPSVQLDDTGLGDEGVYALLVAVRNCISGDVGAAARARAGPNRGLALAVSELHLRGNGISDDGAKAIASLITHGHMGIVGVGSADGGDADGDHGHVGSNLTDASEASTASPSSSATLSIRSIDLRGNFVTRAGIRALAEALEASDRVQHVYVHAGGRIEALGTRTVINGGGGGAASGGEGGNANSANASVIVETICVIDCRDQMPAPETGILPRVDPLHFVSEMTPARSALMQHAISSSRASVVSGIGAIGYGGESVYNSVSGSATSVLSPPRGIATSSSASAGRHTSDASGGSLAGGAFHAAKRRGAVAKAAAAHGAATAGGAPVRRASASDAGSLRIHGSNDLRYMPSASSSSSSSPTPHDGRLDPDGAINALLDDEEAELQREAAAAREAARRPTARDIQREAENRALLQREARWAGRAGGLDVVPLHLEESIGGLPRGGKPKQHQLQPPGSKGGSNSGTGGRQGGMPSKPPHRSPSPAPHPNEYNVVDGQQVVHRPTAARDGHNHQHLQRQDGNDSPRQPPNNNNSNSPTSDAYGFLIAPQPDQHADQGRGGAGGGSGADGLPLPSARLQEDMEFGHRAMAAAEQLLQQQQQPAPQAEPAAEYHAALIGTNGGVLNSSVGSIDEWHGSDQGGDVPGGGAADPVSSAMAAAAAAIGLQGKKKQSAPSSASQVRRLLEASPLAQPVALR